MDKNIVIGVLAVVVLLGGGYWLWSVGPVTPGGVATSTPNPTPAPTPTPTPTPTPNPKPGVPTVQVEAAASVTNFTATVTGSVVPNGSPTTYWYEYGESAALGSRTTPPAIGSGWILISTPATLSGLKANTVYYFRLSAKNAYGTVNTATYNFATLAIAPPTPRAPTVDTTAATAVSTFTAQFNARIHPRGAQTTYWFEYGKDSLLGTVIGTVTGTQTIAAGNASTTVSATATGLSRNTRFYYRAVARNQYGTIFGDIVLFTTKP